MRRLLLWTSLSASTLLVARELSTADEAPARSTATPTPVHVGSTEGGGVVVATEQLIRPAGQSVQFGGRPVDLAVAPNGKAVYVKDNRGVVVLDADRWTVRQEAKFPTEGGGSMHGIVVMPDGKRLLATGAKFKLFEGLIGDDGSIKWGRSIDLPMKVASADSPSEEGQAGAENAEREAKSKPPVESDVELEGGAKKKSKAGSKKNAAKPKDAEAEGGKRAGSYPCGLALLPDGQSVLVCLSINNSLGFVSLAEGKLKREIPVGVAPYAVTVSPDGSTAYVTNWGGRRARSGDKTAKSAGTDTVVDDRGVASTGTVSVIDLAGGKTVKEIAVGLHPAGLALTRDGQTLFVANANSDTVSVIDTGAKAVRQTIAVRPDPALPFGSASNALTLSPDEKTLYVANGGNNAVAVVRLGDRPDAATTVAGFIPAGWFPGAVGWVGGRLAVVNVKGLGSRDASKADKGWNSHHDLGTVTRVDPPDAETLARYTAQVKADAHVPQALAAAERAQSGVEPAAVPRRIGEPSKIEHVIYVIKENRTYDQLFGDIGKGNSDPALCIFGRDVTPNHHALAEQFVLLDNFYCNGVLSADGHQWAMEGFVVDGLEKGFGGWTRSYPYPGDDPLAFPSSGFIWDNALLHGRSFRNFGEMATSKAVPASATFQQIVKDVAAQGNGFRYEQTISVDTLRRYSSPDFPGWALSIPDVARADLFARELKAFEAKGEMPNLTIVYLPSDHTRGTAAGAPSPRAMVADNDLALGRVVEAVSKSKFWATSCVFVIEDDPQNGFDHVDGHRSICLVASPYAKRGQVVSNFYNQTSVLHTMELVLGLPPMNQMDAMAPVMWDCFAAKPDLAPFTALPNRISLEETNPPKQALAPAALKLALQSEAQRMDLSDLADEDTLNRILWHDARGVDAAYPAALAGAHGKGLAKLGLQLSQSQADDDDDDDR